MACLDGSERVEPQISKARGFDEVIRGDVEDRREDILHHAQRGHVWMLVQRTFDFGRQRYGRTRTLAGFIVKESDGAACCGDLPHPWTLILSGHDDVHYSTDSGRGRKDVRVHDVGGEYRAESGH